MYVHVCMYIFEESPVRTVRRPRGVLSYGNSDIEATDRRGSRGIKEERPVLCSDDVRAVCDTEEAG